MFSHSSTTISKRLKWLACCDDQLSLDADMSMPVQINKISVCLRKHGLIVLICSRDEIRYYKWMTLCLSHDVRYSLYNSTSTQYLNCLHASKLVCLYRHNWSWILALDNNVFSELETNINTAACESLFGSCIGCVWFEWLRRDNK